MKKIHLLLTVAAMLFVGVAGFSTGAVTLSVNGTPKEIAAYEIKGNNYFKLRDMAQLLNGTSAQFDVLWDETSKAINLVSGAPYSGTDVLNPATISGAVAASNATSILKDGANVAMCAYMIEGNNFFKLRDLAAVMDFAVTYDAATGLIGMDTTKPYEFPAAPAAFAVNPELFSYIGKTKEQIDARLGDAVSTEFNPVNNLRNVKYDTYTNGCVVATSEPYGGGVRTVSHVKAPLRMLFYNCPETLGVEQLKSLFLDYDYMEFGSVLEISYFNTTIRLPLKEGVAWSDTVAQISAGSGSNEVTEYIHVGNEAQNTLAMTDEKLYARFVESAHNGGIFSGDIQPEYRLEDIDGDGALDLFAADTNEKNYRVVFTARNGAVEPLYFLADNENFATYPVNGADGERHVIYVIVEIVDDTTKRYHKLHSDGSKTLLQTIRVVYDETLGQTNVYSDGKLLPNDEYGSFGEEANDAFYQYIYSDLADFGWGQGYTQDALHWTEV